MNWSITYGLYLLPGIDQDNKKRLDNYEQHPDQFTNGEQLKQFTNFLDSIRPVMETTIKEEHDVDLLSYFSLVKLNLRIEYTLKSLQEGINITEVIKPYIISSANVLQYPERFLALENEINKVLIPKMIEWVKTHTREPYLHTIRTFLKSCLRVGQKPVYEYEFHHQFSQLLLELIKSKTLFDSVDSPQFLFDLVPVVPPAKWPIILTELFKDPDVLKKMEQYKGIEKFLTTVLKPLEAQALLKNNAFFKHKLEDYIPVTPEIVAKPEQNKEVELSTRTLRELNDKIEKAKQTLLDLNDKIEQQQHHLDNMTDNTTEPAVKRGCIPYFR